MVKRLTSTCAQSAVTVVMTHIMFSLSTAIDHWYVELIHVSVRAHTHDFIDAESKVFCIQYKNWGQLDIVAALFVVGNLLLLTH